MVHITMTTGAPASNQPRTQIAAHVPRELVRRIDEMADREDRTRSQTIERLLVAALDVAQ